MMKEVEEEELLHRLRLVALEGWNDWVSGDWIQNVVHVDGGFEVTEFLGLE